MPEEEYDAGRTTLAPKDDDGGGCWNTCGASVPPYTLYPISSIATFSSLAFSR